jgi:protein SCO1/2
MRRTDILGTIAAVGALAAAAAGWSWISGLREIGPAAAPQIAGATAIGGSFELVAHTGERVTDADFRGRYLLVAFGYTYCPDVCPLTLQRVSVALAELGADARAVQVVFLTVDPQRDTPEALASYLEAFDPGIIGLTGTAEQVDRAAKAYRVYYARVETEDDVQGDDYLMDHSAILYLMGPDGSYLAHFSPNDAPTEIAKTIRQHLRDATS